MRKTSKTRDQPTRLVYITRSLLIVTYRNNLNVTIKKNYCKMLLTKG